MAPKINAENVSKETMFLVPPDQIKAELNGRFAPHDDNDVQKMLSSFKEKGQLQPVLVRKLPDHTLTLVAGFRRHAAALLYSAEQPEFKLKCMLFVGNEEEAFRANIEENIERKKLNPMDLAFQVRIWRERFGKKDKDIAKLYGFTPAYISQIKKLLSLSPDIQDKVKDEIISMSAALKLADLTEEEQREVIKESEPEQEPEETIEDVIAKDEGEVTEFSDDDFNSFIEDSERVEPEEKPKKKGKKIKTSSITEKVNKKKRKSGKAVPLSYDQVKNFFVSLTDSTEEMLTKDFAECIVDWMEGRVGDDVMTARILDLTT